MIGRRLGSALGLACAVAAGSPAHARDFAFEVAAPAFRVTLPGIPGMTMQVHPMHAEHAQLRYLGTEGPYSVAIITPSAQAGMNALECASATLGAIARRAGAPARDQMYRAKLNERTYVAIYATPLPTALQLNAHVLSAAGGTHCVEVHATKVSTSPEELDAWVKGFEQADIQPR